jgi:putative membrane protein
MQGACGGMAISMAGLPAFLLYFALGVALIACFTAVYLRLTAHDEIALIRGGNLSAAVALGGNVTGFSIPLEKAIAQASSIPDLVLWAIAAMIIQFGAYGVARILIPELSRKIEEDRLPSAAMLAVIAVISGTLAAASMTA